MKFLQNIVRYQPHYHPPLIFVNKGKVFRKKLINRIEQELNTKFVVEYFFPQDEKSNFNIEEARLIVQLVASFHSTESILICISGLDQSSLEAQNALLKVLEDASERIIFLLEVENLSQLPSTILSRCQVYTEKLAPKSEDLSLENLSEEFCDLAKHVGISNKNLESEIVILQESMARFILNIDQKNPNILAISDFSSELDTALYQLQKLKMSSGLVYLHLRSKLLLLKF